MRARTCNQDRSVSRLLAEVISDVRVDGQDYGPVGRVQELHDDNARHLKAFGMVRDHLARSEDHGVRWRGVSPLLHSSRGEPSEDLIQARG